MLCDIYSTKKKSLLVGLIRKVSGEKRYVLLHDNINKITSESNPMAIIF